MFSFFKRILILAAIVAPAVVQAQLKIVSGSQGTLQDKVNKTSVNYTVSEEGCASYLENFDEVDCSINMSNLKFPWTGNCETHSSVTYTFSKPVYYVVLVINGVGVQGRTDVVEHFEIRVNDTTPALSMQPGTCGVWKLEGGLMTSPSSEGSFAGVVKVSSDTPFTKLEFINDENKVHTGGCGLGLLESGVCVKKTEPCSTPFVVPPPEK